MHKYGILFLLAFLSLDSIISRVVIASAYKYWFILNKFYQPMMLVEGRDV